MYNVGDVVECIDNDNGKKEITIGKQYIIDKMSLDSIYIVTDKGRKGHFASNRFKTVSINAMVSAPMANPCSEISLPPDSLAARHEWAVTPTKSPVSELKPCICTHSFLAKGCQCGAIAKRKWGLQG